nr:RING-H2 finger protein ATL74-like [Ipomoea batatas]
METRPGNESSRTPHRNGYSNEASFDTNMVIILAALLCALLCALGLNSIVRCAVRFSRRFGLDSEGEAGGGLKKSSLKEIPVAVYGSGVNIPATDCPICLGEFVDGEKVRVLPKCHHGFHVRCIDVWLAAHPSCPTCRQSLIEQPPPSDAAADVEAGVLAKDEIVLGDTALVPPKYHFLIIPATFAFSTSIDESSFPSVANTICSTIDERLVNIAECVSINSVHILKNSCMLVATSEFIVGAAAHR